ncbi:hypothetical protein ACFSDX_11170 [Hymenobacter bucti]|uniref:Lipoprotein n=1 Tax=Hymenobacter bucti TaxID=1844114 RepID=A0ABW4QUH9_9BACT
MMYSKIRFSLSALIILMVSCQESITCQVYKKRFYSKEVNIVVADKGPIGNSFVVKGLNPITGRNIFYTDIDGIYNYVYNILEVGDTLMKTKNNAVFTIEKKKINILVFYDCLNGSYRGGGVLDTLPKLTYGKIIVDTIPKE